MTLNPPTAQGLNFHPFSRKSTANKRAGGQISFQHQDFVTCPALGFLAGGHRTHSGAYTLQANGVSGPSSGAAGSNELQLKMAAMYISVCSSEIGLPWIFFIIFLNNGGVQGCPVSRIQSFQGPSSPSSLRTDVARSIGRRSIKPFNQLSMLKQ